ncbi:bacteriocin immunity protein [Streptococcus himalayensis]|uniref:Bacteriocin immunity protein n=1 Tax=Streptococcus himalayensis TaxID=1888195 RepID=A0A917A3S3_9STRE|nr:bacteriocin immunity protein [Streptococcus himalayensis]GGE23580.1 hypothetical protein GCM10011510_00820 [Streptococcus himalayensis]
MTDNDLLTEIVNLILNPTIKEEERAILRRFKDQAHPNKDMSLLIPYLAEELRQLAVQNIRKNTHLSKEVANFYQKIAYYAKSKQELGRGLLSVGMTFGR